MKMKNIIAKIMIFSFLILPNVTLAQNWNVGVGGDGWSVNVGSGSGSGSGAFNTGNNYGLPSGSILGIIQGILFWLLAAISMIAIIGFIISGIMYLLAAGDEGQIGKAKKALTFSIIGVIVGLSGFVILQAAMYLLNAQSF